MLVQVNPWPRLLAGMSPLAPLAMGPSVGHMGCSTVRIRTFLNYHVPYTHTTSRKGNPLGRGGLSAFYVRPLGSFRFDDLAQRHSIKILQEKVEPLWEPPCVRWRGVRVKSVCVMAVLL